jgi:hypothetical protein
MCNSSKCSNKRKSKSRMQYAVSQTCFDAMFALAWFPYSHNGRKDRVTIFLNGQILIVFTCKAHINHTYSLFIITLPIISVKLLHFSCWKRSWLNLYDHMETRLFNELFLIWHPKWRKLTNTCNQKTHAVYSIPCGDCEKEYLGQSKRQFGTRLKEHQKAVSSLDKGKSALVEHVCYTKHEIAWENSKVITTNNRYGQRLCLEAWHINE